MCRLFSAAGFLPEGKRFLACIFFLVFNPCPSIKIDIYLFYFDKGGNPLNEDVTTLPWTKEITVDAGVNGITASASGYGGVKDQTLTAKIYVGGKVVKESTAKAGLPSRAL